MAIDVHVTVDCADPRALAAFWAEALGYKPGPDLGSDLAVVLDPARYGPRLLFQKVPEPRTVKNRMHLDLRVAQGVGDERMAQLEAECLRLVALGAIRVERREPGETAAEPGFIVMRDPEGNEFCLE